LIEFRSGRPAGRWRKKKKESR